MKTIINFIIVTLLFVAIDANAAESSFTDKLYNEMKSKEGVTCITITKAMIESFGDGDAEDSEKLKRLTQSSSGLEELKIINIDIIKSKISKAKMKEIRDHFKSDYDDYEVMMEMNFEDLVLKMMSNKEKKDYLFYKMEKDNILIITAKGTIDLRELMTAAMMLEMDTETD